MAVATALLLTLGAAPAPQAGEKKPKEDPLIGKEAPELETSEWVGKSQTLKDLRGKVVVLEFFQML